jgi:hypothetical protein
MTPEAPAPLSSPGLEQRSEEAQSVPNEASPLLQAAGHDDASPRSLPAAVSAFLDKNAGLLLVAASQFFISASNVSVKYLNSLDEHVPMLEVRWLWMTSWR